MPPPKGAATQWLVCTLPTGCSPLQQPSGVVYVYLRVIHVPSLHSLAQNKISTNIKKKLKAVFMLTNLMFKSFKGPRVVENAVLDAVGCNGVVVQ